jgi:hypothetical protein
MPPLISWGGRGVQVGFSSNLRLLCWVLTVPSPWHRRVLLCHLGGCRQCCTPWCHCHSLALHRQEMPAVVRSPSGEPSWGFLDAQGAFLARGANERARSPLSLKLGESLVLMRRTHRVTLLREWTTTSQLCRMDSSALFIIGSHGIGIGGGKNSSMALWTRLKTEAPRRFDSSVR